MSKKCLFDEWADDIKKYCESNGLDFEIAKRLPKCWGKNVLYLQYCDPLREKKGLLDEMPAPIVLSIKCIDGELIFSQTEYTKKHLGKSIE